MRVQVVVLTCSTAARQVPRKPLNETRASRNACAVVGRPGGASPRGRHRLPAALFGAVLARVGRERRVARLHKHGLCEARFLIDKYGCGYFVRHFQQRGAHQLRVGVETVNKMSRLGRYVIIMWPIRSTVLLDALSGPHYYSSSCFSHFSARWSPSVASITGHYGYSRW